MPKKLENILNKNKWNYNFLNHIMIYYKLIKLKFLLT